MDNIDGRRLSDSIREEIRFKAIKDWHSGMNPTNLARKYGTSRKIVYQWIDRYSQEDWDGLKTRTGKTEPKPSDSRYALIKAGFYRLSNLAFIQAVRYRTESSARKQASSEHRLNRATNVSTMWYLLPNALG